MADPEIARDYDDINPVSDNAYLYYIHFRIGHTNKLLKEIKAALYFIAGAFVGLSLHFAGILLKLG